MPDPASNDDIRRDIAELKQEVAKISSSQERLYNAFMGSYDNPGGYVITIAENQRRLNRIEERQDHSERDVDELKRYKEAIKNKLIGIGIGLSLGSAGIGATVATVISRILQ